MTDTDTDLIVVAKRDGFRRAGRTWHGSTTVYAGDLTADEIAQLQAEPMLHVTAAPADGDEAPPTKAEGKGKARSAKSPNKPAEAEPTDTG